MSRARPAATARDVCRNWQPAQSGHGIDADIITATGFTIRMMGDIAFSRDGRALDFSQTVAYRGAMFTGAPNLALGVWRPALAQDTTRC